MLDSSLKVVYLKKTISSNSLIDTAEEQGYFEQNGVKLEMVLAKQAHLPLLLAKRADISAILITSALNAFLNNHNVKWLASTNNYNPTFFIVSRFPKAELKSVRKVGIVNKGGGDHLLMQTILLNMGLNISNLEYVEVIEEAQRAKLLSEGKIDLAFINYKKNREEPEAKGCISINPRELFEDLCIPHGIVSTKDALEQKGEAVKGFVKSIYQAIQYNDTNGDEVITSFKEEYGLSELSAASLYQDIIDSRANFSYVPKQDISKLVKLVSSITRPANPQRNLRDFAFKDFAREAITR